MADAILPQELTLCASLTLGDRKPCIYLPGALFPKVWATRIRTVWVPDWRGRGRWEENAVTAKAKSWKRQARSPLLSQP